MLFGSCVALQEIGLLANMFLGGFSFSLSSPVLLSGQAKSGSGFHTGHGWFFFFPLGGLVFFLLCLGAAFSLKSGGVLPRPAKIRLAFLRPARCARLFLRSRSAVVRSFSGFGVRLAGGSLFSSLSLSLSLVVLLFFFVFGAATLFLMPRPLLGRLWGSRAFWPPGLPSMGRPGARVLLPGPRW